MLQIVHIIEGS